MTLAFFINDGLYHHQCRLAGIDAAEIKTKNKDEKEEATVAKVFLKSLIMDKMVIVKCTKEKDKYGRILGTIFLNGQNINEKMIQEGHAYRYDGGTKKAFNAWGKK